MSPTRTTRLLIRTVLGLCAVSWLLSASDWAGGAPAACDAAEPTPGRMHRPTRCDFITRLGVDFRNDPVAPSRAFYTGMGEIAGDRLGLFHVYALSDDDRFYWNVTFETKATTFRVRTPAGSGKIEGRWIYTTANNIPTYHFAPRGRLSPQDRIAFIDVGYHCRAPRSTYRTRFMLTVRGTAREAPVDLPNTAEKPDLTADWEQAQLVPGGAGPRAPHRLIGTLRLRNSASAEAVASRVALFVSYDREPGPEDLFVGFSDLPGLAAGAEAVVELDLPFRGVNWLGPKHVLAVVDSSNYAYETNEQNNLAIMGPLP